MVLHDVCLYGSAERKHIHIKGPVIQRIAGLREELDTLSGELRLELNGATVLPGFINSHDHLDFNLYPQLGNSIYSNYTEWGNDIHVANAGIIKAVLQVPLALRIQWGLYKNLLNGFTTVVNHGKKLLVDDELVNVFQECYALHSPAFEKNWLVKLNYPFRNKKPFVMHIGEGTDAAAQAEIDRVRKKNFFTRKIVAVHGVAMDTQQAEAFAGLVWCPASNYFLLNATAPVEKLKQKTTVVFGTDSTLTSSWGVTAHFTCALQSGMVTEKELLGMLTIAPACLWGMKDRGQIKEGMRADLLIVKESNRILSDYPREMIITNGRIVMFTERYASQLSIGEATSFDRILYKGMPVYVKPGITELVKQIVSFYPAAEIPFTID
jgi:cytosine/adenosine deaminase-related metal-dependent hydrolase